MCACPPPAPPSLAFSAGLPCCPHASVSRQPCLGGAQTARGRIPYHPALALFKTDPFLCPCSSTPSSTTAFVGLHAPPLQAAPLSPRHQSPLSTLLYATKPLLSLLRQRLALSFLQPTTPYGASPLLATDLLLTPCCRPAPLLP